MASWLPLALAVSLGVSSACLAAEPQPVVTPGSVNIHDLSLGLAAQALGSDGSAGRSEADRAVRLASPASERRMRLFDLHLGRTSRAGRSPGDAPPLYGEVGIDLHPRASLSIVPSYRVVLDQSDRPDSETIDTQVVKLGARIRF